MDRHRVSPRPESDPAWADDVGRWDPGPERRGPIWQTARLALLMAVVLAALVAAVLLLPGVSVPGLGGPASPSPTPGPSPTATPRPTASPSSTPARPTPTPGPTFVSYLVRAGDNLGTIARRFETTPRSIAWWNRETYPSLDPLSPDYEPDRIEIGWRLALVPGTVFDESQVPGASGRPGPTAAATTPPPTSGGPSSVISNGPRDSNRVALTFDMGGRLDPAVDILTWLVENRVPGTIFPTGREASENDVGRAAMAIVRLNPDLFVVGNHSWDHPTFTELSGTQMRSQVERAEAAVLEVVGRTTKPYFRPPYGAWNAAVRDNVGGAGWAWTVMWDVDTIDWRPTSDGGPTAEEIEAKVLANAEGGSIVLMHLGGWNTLEALPGILDGLRERGLQPVTLTQLLAG